MARRAPEGSPSSAQNNGGLAISVANHFDGSREHDSLLIQGRWQNVVSKGGWGRSRANSLEDRRMPSDPLSHHDIVLPERSHDLETRLLEH